MKSTIVLLAMMLTAMLVCMTGCGKKEPAELTLDGPRNATYRGIEEQDPVTL